MYQCTCPFGFSGRTCEHSEVVAANCQNGATPVVGAPVCLSPANVSTFAGKPRTQHTVTVTDEGNVIIAGGTTSTVRHTNAPVSSVLADIWLYTLATNTWSPLAAFPYPMYGHAAVWSTARQQVIVGAGSTVVNSVLYAGSVLYAITPATGQVTTLGPMPGGATNPLCAIVAGRFILLLGGITDLFLYNETTMAFISQIPLLGSPFPSDPATFAIAGTRLFLAGLYYPYQQTSSISGDVTVYDVATNTTFFLPNALSPLVTPGPSYDNLIVGSAGNRVVFTNQLGGPSLVTIMDATTFLTTSFETTEPFNYGCATQGHRYSYFGGSTGAQTPSTMIYQFDAMTTTFAPAPYGQPFSVFAKCGSYRDQAAYVSGALNSGVGTTNLTMMYFDPTVNGHGCTYTALCNCPPGYSGASCQTQIDECASAPCQNGATCSDLVNGYSCLCASGWFGPQCASETNYCMSSPCEHGATCQLGVNSYVCACLPGYSGTQCQTNVNECASAPCQHGGTCIDGLNSYQCICPPGYSGGQCGTDINECASAPCLNGGSCLDGVAGFVCSCASGYNGTLCQSRSDNCASQPCQHGGVCNTTQTGFVCTCNATSGWMGDRCDVQLMACASSPCAKGGTCTQGIASYSCQCARGFSGTDCLTDIDECASTPCANGGTCVDQIGAFTCTCPVGVYGLTCAIQAACASLPCSNGATCNETDTADASSYTCLCAPGFSGPTCASPIDLCASLPCHHFGRCTMTGPTSFACACLSGFSGALCQTDVDECASSPCAAGGTCIDGVNAYRCECPIGTEGPHCQTSVLCDGSTQCASTAHQTCPYPFATTLTCLPSWSTFPYFPVELETLTFVPPQTLYLTDGIMYNSSVGESSHVYTYELIPNGVGWTDLGAMPQGGRASHCAAYSPTSNLVLVVGGLSLAGAALTTISVVNITANNTFSTSSAVNETSISYPLIGCALYHTAGQFVAVGSTSDFGHALVLPITDDGTFSIGTPQLLVGAQSGTISSVLLGSMLYVMGLTYNGSPAGHLELYNTQTGATAIFYNVYADPVSGSHLPVGSAAGRLLIISSSTSDTTLATLVEFDVATNLSFARETFSAPIALNSGWGSNGATISRFAFFDAEDANREDSVLVLQYDSVARTFGPATVNLSVAVTGYGAVASARDMAIFMGGSVTAFTLQATAELTLFPDPSETGLGCTIGPACECQMGFYGRALNAAPLACSPCAPGRSGPMSGLDMCIPCAPGSTQPAFGGTACLTCLPQTYSAVVGMSNATCTPCANSTVQPNAGATSCLNCSVGRYGPQCSLNVTAPSPCASFPCQHGGTCVDDGGTDGGYRCVCPVSFNGTSCGHVRPFCSVASPPPCPGNLTCVDVESGAFACVRADVCASSPCQHGGTCVTMLLNSASLNTTTLAPGTNVTGSISAQARCWCPLGVNGTWCQTVANTTATANETAPSSIPSTSERFNTLTSAASLLLLVSAAVSTALSITTALVPLTAATLAANAATTTIASASGVEATVLAVPTL